MIQISLSAQKMPRYKDKTIYIKQPRENKQERNLKVNKYFFYQ